MTSTASVSAVQQHADSALIHANEASNKTAKRSQIATEKALELQLVSRLVHPDMIHRSQLNDCQQEHDRRLHIDPAEKYTYVTKDNDTLNPDPGLHALLQTWNT